MSNQRNYIYSDSSSSDSNSPVVPLGYMGDDGTTYYFYSANSRPNMRTRDKLIILTIFVIIMAAVFIILSINNSTRIENLVESYNNMKDTIIKCTLSTG
ncbi:17048_t:CDS:2 [Dentiscutata erythropus]|uniref:17048_t:CDS:1 n=1 Tax=Dentiscutata erythropus TaxID=1348616 RepID=A0A9N9I815_9GLOM|nr:17048_t:CDS:2 [Dentiscutata erythropus]